MICSEDGCDRTLHKARGLCLQHYRHHKYRGTLPPRKSLLTRFEEKYIPVPETGCWIWLGATGGVNNYGHMRIDGADKRAHRVSYEMHIGEIPEHDSYHGTCVCHKCDEPLCVNPAHLFLGTMADNMADMVAKGRGVVSYKSRGNGRPTKLNSETAMGVYKALGTQMEIANQFGICRSLVSYIKTKRSWKLIHETQEGGEFANTASDGGPLGHLT